MEPDRLDLMANWVTPEKLHHLARLRTPPQPDVPEITQFLTADDLRAMVGAKRRGRRRR